MKPKAKKTIIVMLAIAAVAVIAYFAFFNKAKAGTAEGYIDRLSISRDMKRAIKSHLSQAALEDMTTNMAANPGLNYEQTLALTAAYYLVNDHTIDDATWQQWKAQVMARG